MKRKLLLLMVLGHLTMNAQLTPTANEESPRESINNQQIELSESIKKNRKDSLNRLLPDRYLTLNFSVGYDFPSIKNNLPYVNYKQGLLLGASVNYYWNNFGLGADLDYITNNVENSYPTQNLFYENNALNGVSLQTNAIKRTALTIGPSLKFQSGNHRLNLELFARAGVANIKGGNVELRTGTGNMLLNHFRGFNAPAAITGKGGARLNYYFTENIGLHLGGYFMKHLKVNDPVENGYTAFIRNYETVDSNNNILNNFDIREKSCDCDLDSYGVTAGISMKFGAKKEPVIANAPVVAPVSTNTLTVTAVDKISKEKLPFVDVALVNSKGEIIRTGTTNYFGAVVFDDLQRDQYTINSKLYNEDLEGSEISKNDFTKDAAIQRIVYYTKQDLIVKGKVLDCKTKQPLQNANIYAENVNMAYNKTTVTDQEGNFLMKLESGKMYKIYASKSLYFSEIKEYTASANARNNSPFFNLELCAENADCGNSIKLNKIYYDFNKATLRVEAYPELEKLLQFLKDNPSAKVELSSHTDSRGSDEYNQKLSDARAKSVVDYLINSGINKSRLIPVGMGERKILNHCKNGVPCSDDEHIMNRRTELRVICTEKN